MRRVIVVRKEFVRCRTIIFTQPYPSLAASRDIRQSKSKKIHQRPARVAAVVAPCRQRPRRISAEQGQINRETYRYPMTPFSIFAFLQSKKRTQSTVVVTSEIRSMSPSGSGFVEGAWPGEFGGGSRNEINNRNRLPDQYKPDGAILKHLESLIEYDSKPNATRLRLTVLCHSDTAKGKRRRDHLTSLSLSSCHHRRTSGFILFLSSTAANLASKSTR